MKLIKLLLVPALLLTSACKTTDTTSTKTRTGSTEIERNVPCSQLRIIRLSRMDTPGTKEQVIPQNQMIVEVCGLPWVLQ